MKRNCTNHKTNEGYIKLGIMNLAQQNLYMLKRLTEKKSEYSAKKMEEDYKKTQNYKKIMCNFPCINFNKVKRVFSCDHKNYQNEKKEFLPTLNYINDGYLEKMKKKSKDKKQEDNKSEKNKSNDKIEQKYLINKKLESKKIEIKNESDKDKENIINISKNEIS